MVLWAKLGNILIQNYKPELLSIHASGFLAFVGMSILSGFWILYFGLEWKK